MLTPREFDQLHLALFAMARTRINGIAQLDYDHTMALLKSYTEGNLEVAKDGPDGLTVSFTPAEGKTDETK